MSPGGITSMSEQIKLIEHLETLYGPRPLLRLSAQKIMQYDLGEPEASGESATGEILFPDRLPDDSIVLDKPSGSA